MTPSKKVFTLIKKHEGLRLEPYLCPAGVPTIGFGTTYYSDGISVSMEDDKITELQAEDLLFDYLEYRLLDRLIEMIRVELNQNQFDALLSFTYNVGIGAFKASTLRKRINNHASPEKIAYEFMRWHKGGGKVLPGLIKRRADEIQLYFS